MERGGWPNLGKIWAQAVPSFLDTRSRYTLQWSFTLVRDYALTVTNPASWQTFVSFLTNLQLSHLHIQPSHIKYTAENIISNQTNNNPFSFCATCSLLERPHCHWKQTNGHASSVFSINWSQKISSTYPIVCASTSPLISANSRRLCHAWFT